MAATDITTELLFIKQIMNFLGMEMNEKMNMSCGSRPRNEVNKVPVGWSCHDWLWQRY